MPYIGQAPTSVAFLTDSFSGNGSTTAFTMSVAPANTASVIVAISGVLQDPSTYSVSGTTLTFSAAPPTGTANISARYLGIPASGVTTTAYRTKTEFTATSGQTTFTPPSYTVGFIDVFRNGVLLGSADYTASNGTTVVLTNAATSGDLITTESFYISSVLNAIPATAGSVGSTYIANGAVGSTQIATGGVAQTNLAAGVAGNGPAFSAYLNTSQTLSSGVFTKITLNAKEYDTANAFDATTNYRFTPQVAGYYQFNAQLTISSSVTTQVIALYKNGSSYIRLSNYNLNTECISGSWMIYLNGSTDYIEMYGIVGSGQALNTGLNVERNNLQGFLARSQ
jgi:hypothetical protein